MVCISTVFAPFFAYLRHAVYDLGRTHKHTHTDTHTYTHRLGFRTHTQNTHTHTHTHTHTQGADANVAEDVKKYLVVPSAMIRGALASLGLFII